MQKRDDSLNSLGRTLIAVDKPLRADIKALAARQSMTMVEYLRSKVEQDKQADPQAIMVSNTAPATKSDVSRLGAALAVLNEKVETWLHLVADTEPEQIAFFKILAYGQDKQAYTPETLKNDISQAIDRIKAMQDKLALDTGESEKGMELV